MTCDSLLNDAVVVLVSEAAIVVGVILFAIVKDVVRGH